MTRIDCEDVIRVLYAYLDGELSPASEREIDEHVRLCQECMGRTEFERRLRARVAEIGTTRAPEALKHRLAALLDDEP